MDQFSMLLDHDADPTMGLDKFGRNILHLLASRCTGHDLRTYTKIVLKKVQIITSNNQRLGSAFDDLDPRLALLCQVGDVVIRPCKI